MRHLQSLALHSRVLPITPSQAELSRLADDLHAVMVKHDLAVSPFVRTVCTAKLEVGATGAPQAVIECRLALG